MVCILNFSLNIKMKSLYFRVGVAWVDSDEAIQILKNT